jgi:hypothetical protein
LSRRAMNPSTTDASIPHPCGLAARMRSPTWCRGSSTRKPADALQRDPMLCAATAGEMSFIGRKSPVNVPTTPRRRQH